MKLKSDLFTIGCDRSEQLCEKAREKYTYIPIVVADNLHLPYRDNLFDAVLSIGVIHHLASHERRVQAIRGSFSSFCENFTLQIARWLNRVFTHPESRRWAIVDLHMGYGTEASHRRCSNESADAPTRNIAL